MKFKMTGLKLFGSYQYKDDRKYNVDIDWRKVKACKTINDFVAFVDKLDVFNTWYSDINWTGYDFCIVTDGSRG